VDTTSRRIEYAPLDDIAGMDGNPKGHDLDVLIRAIATLGFTDPAVLDERTEQLIIGHGRLEALRLIRAYVAGDELPDRFAPVFENKRVRDALSNGDGTTHPPDGIQITGDGEWTVPLVRGWSSRDDEHARAAVIASNKITERGGWDEHALAEWLDSISDIDPDLLDVTGFSADDLDVMLRDLGAFADRTSGIFDDTTGNGHPGGTGDSAEESEETEEGEGLTEVDDDGDRHDGDLEYVQVSWVVNADQRKTIRKALALAQKRFGLATSAIALNAVAEHFLANQSDTEGAA
jgi:hypothetical protein